LVNIREKIIYLGVMMVILLIVYFLIISGRIDLKEFWTQVAASLVSSALVIGCIAFRTEINDWIHRPKNMQVSFQNTKPETNVTQVLGSPVRIDQCIQYYDSRDQLNFPEFMNLAKKEIQLSALTFTMLRLNHENLMRQLLVRKIRMTFLLLDPNSTEAKRQTGLHRGSDDLSDQIRKTLDLLCRLKKNYPKKIVIMTYTLRAAASLIIIDKKLVKEETRTLDSDANSRPSKITFREDNKHFFNTVSNAYKDVLISSTEYNCETSNSSPV
jgi:hypothetical protein